jgi:hypothetical protein
MKEGNIRTDRQFDDQLAFVRRVVVVLRQPLAHLAGGDAHHRIGVGVIAGRAAEDLDPDASFLELGGVAQQRLIHHMRQQRGVALAVGEERMGQQPLQLLPDCRRLQPGIRRQSHSQLLQSVFSL